MYPVTLSLYFYSVIFLTFFLSFYLLADSFTSHSPQPGKGGRACLHVCKERKWLLLYINISNHLTDKAKQFIATIAVCSDTVNMIAMQN